MCQHRACVFCNERFPARKGRGPYCSEKCEIAAAEVGELSDELRSLQFCRKPAVKTSPVVKQKPKFGPRKRPTGRPVGERLDDAFRMGSMAHELDYSSVGLAEVF